MLRLGSGAEWDPDSLSHEASLTVFLSFGWHGPLICVLQGAVEGELEPSVGEDGDQGGVQAFVEDQGAFGPVHGHHGVSQGFIDLDTTHAMMSEIVSAREPSPPAVFPLVQKPATRNITSPARRTKKMLDKNSKGGTVWQLPF